MIHCDFETYSEVDIKKRGGKIYAHHPSTMPLCLAYAFDEDAPGLWNLSSKTPTELLDRIADGEEFAAFNAAFDMRIWNNICVRDFHWPEIKLSQVVDVQTLAQAYTLPGSLDKSGEALGIHMLKSKTGTALIKKCCCPDKNGKQPMPNTPEMRQAFRDLEKYCLQDVRAMQEIVYSLPRPRLIPQEQLIWELTYNMNDEGLPIDDIAVRAIIKYLDAYITYKVKDLPKATGGAVSTPGQIAKIKAFCESKGVKLSDLTALTVERTLARRELPPAVRTVLELRQELGRSSTAKYKKVAEQMIALDGDGVYRVYDNVACHATNTGRWGGRGFQMHNLPRAKKKKPERWIKYFLDNVRMTNPVGAAKALIRPMIKAPDGWAIIVSDYSSIENRILAWSAGDTQTLQDFADGVDQYKTMASARFGVPYSEVTKEQRGVGKAIILGCIAEGTKVVTQKGLVNIEDITKEHLLFDGENWVHHQGVVSKGERSCINFAGVWMTPDHKVYIGGTKKEAQEWQAKNMLSESQVICSAIGKLLSLCEEQTRQIKELGTGCSVLCAEKNILTEYHTWKVETLQNVGTADQIHTVADLESLKQLLKDLRISWLQLSQGARMKITNTLKDTETEELRCAPNGSAATKPFSSMPLLSLGTMTQLLSSIESTIMETTSQVMSGLSPISKTVVTSKTCDILLAGELERFMVCGSKGPIIASNCGYGMGGPKFKQTAKDQADLDLTDDEAKASVDAYRSHYHLIKTMWTDLKKAAVKAVVTRSQVTSGKFTFGTFVKANRRWLAMKLPTGKCLYYLNPTVNDMLIPGFEEMGPTPTITHEGYSSYTRKWTRLKLIPGRITENAIQGTAREVMAQGLLNIQRDMPQIRLLGSVHDEAMGLIRLDDLTGNTLEEFSAHLCNVDFLPGCPLAAEGYISKRYKKD